MKFLFSLLLLAEANAQMVKIYSYHTRHAEWLREIFITEQNIPEEVIEMGNVYKSCDEIIVNDDRLEICLEASGEMVFLATPENIIQTLRTFKI